MLSHLNSMTCMSRLTQGYASDAIIFCLKESQKFIRKIYFGHYLNFQTYPFCSRPWRPACGLDNARTRAIRVSSWGPGVATPSGFLVALTIRASSGGLSATTLAACRNSIFKFSLWNRNVKTEKLKDKKKWAVRKVKIKKGYCRYQLTWMLNYWRIFGIKSATLYKQNLKSNTRQQ